MKLFWIIVGILVAISFAFVITTIVRDWPF